MGLTLQLPSDAERELRSRAQAEGLSVEGYAERLLIREMAISNEPAPGRFPLREVTSEILERMRGLPAEAFEGLPVDGASQHDHYIYGTSKRDL